MVPLMERPLHHQFILHHGHAEERSLSQIALFHEVGFLDPIEAIVEFRALLQEFADEAARKDCCEGNKQKDPGASFCRDCGDPLSLPEEEKEALVAELFCQMFSLTLDSGARFLDLMEDSGWTVEFRPLTHCEPVIFENVDRWLLDPRSTLLWQCGSQEGFHNDRKEESDEAS